MTKELNCLLYYQLKLRSRVVLSWIWNGQDEKDSFKCLQYRSLHVHCISIFLRPQQRIKLLWSILCSLLKEIIDLWYHVGQRGPSVHSKVNHSNLFGPMSTFSIFKDGDTFSRDLLWALVPVPDLNH